MKFVGIFFISVAVLVLEVLQMRFYSLAIWYHLAYMVITVALLGFGAAGSALYAFPKLVEPNKIGNRLAWLGLLFAISLVISFLVTCRVPLDTFQLLAPPPKGFSWLPIGKNKPLQLMYVFLYYVVMLPAYFFAGLIIVAAFRHFPKVSARTYFFNLVGSAVGSFGVVVLIRPLGGEGMVLFVAALAVLGALAFALSEPSPNKRLIGTAWVLLALLCIAYPFKDSLFKVRVADTKALRIFERIDPNLKHEFKKWDPVARIDVVSSTKSDQLMHLLRGIEHKMITIDGDAYTYLYRFPKNLDQLKPLDESLYSAGYWVVNQPHKVLAVGLGGGIDIATALYHKPKRIVGVELNRTMIEVTGKVYAEFNNHLYERQGVEIVHGEGRSFLARTNEQFDLIQMSGVDTWSALASGAYVLSENYLYTVEALSEYLDRLTPNGVLCIVRWIFSPPRETLRLVSVASQALKQKGVNDPSSYMAVLSQALFGALLLKKKPFTQDEIERIKTHLGKQQVGEIRAIYLPYQNGDTYFHRFFAAFRKGNEALEAFLREYRFDVSPVYDDKPFFFRYYKWRDFFANSFGFGGPVESMFPIGLWVLFFSLAQAALFALLLILGPIWFKRAHVTDYATARLRAPVLVYFSLLGAAYMLIEIGLMQKLVLFLGHPTYSIAITLAALLFFSGLGSLASERLTPSLSFLLKVLGIVVALGIAILFVAIPLLVDLAFGAKFFVRAGLTILVLAPLGFVMGMPFPIGVRLLGANERSAPLVAWGFGANGTLSVVASVGAIALAMWIGFSAVLAIGLSLYALAAADVVWWRRNLMR